MFQTSAFLVISLFRLNHVLVYLTRENSLKIMYLRRRNLIFICDIFRIKKRQYVAPTYLSCHSISKSSTKPNIKKSSFNVLQLLSTFFSCVCQLCPLVDKKESERIRRRFIKKINTKNSMFKHKLWCIERKEVERIVLNQKDMTFYGEHSIKKNHTHECQSLGICHHFYSCLSASKASLRCGSDWKINKI